MFISTYQKHQQILTFYLLGILVFVNRFLILKLFNLEYVGSDDLIFWQAAVDYAQGIFHEPFFYGQDYNFALEAILAAPLINWGVPVDVALPVVSSLMGVFPFLFISTVLFRRGKRIEAYLFLFIPLTLSVEYDIITSITRGFTSGLFFCSLLIYPLLNPTKLWSFVIAALAVSFGYIFNANSLVLSFPICLFLLFENYRKPAFYLVFGVLSIPALLIKYFSEQFYVDRPEYLVHSMWKLKFDFEVMLEGISHLDQYFRYLMPVIWPAHWMILLLLLILAIIITKQNWKKGISLLLTVIFIILLFGVNKINDDIGVIFLSSTRMFLAMPLLLGLAFLWLKKGFLSEQKWRVMILSLGMLVFLIKATAYSAVIDKHTEETNYGPVAIKKLDDLIDDCAEMEKITRQYNVDLVVFIPNWEYRVPSMEFYNYGCPILQENTVSSTMNLYERRTWIFQKERDMVRKNIILFNFYPDHFELLQKEYDIEQINEHPSMILIRENDKSLLELSEAFDFPLKRHNY